MKHNGFFELNQEDLMQVDGGGLFEDIGYGIGYGARWVFEKVIKPAAEKAPKPSLHNRLL